LTTNKILDSDIFGVLPEYLNKLFITIEPDYDFLRKGVTRTLNSFIECIVEEFDEEFKQFSRNDDRIPDFLIKTREDLIKKYNVSITKQENYNETINEITQNILDTTQYFNPLKYYRLLEEKYNCNIYIFNKDSLCIPNHLQNFLRLSKRYTRSIFIYEHMGSESDNALYPQCEIITGVSLLSVDTQFFYLLYNHKISIGIETIFIKYNQSYLYNRLSQRITLPSFTKNLTIIAQSIDGYGKTRVLYFKFFDKEISLFTNPIPPFNIIEKPFEYNPVDINLAVELFEELNIPIFHQTVINDKCVEISGFYNEILYTCVINPSDILEEKKNISIGYNRSVIPTSQSELKLFNNKYKQAKHLSQLFLHSFSKYFQTLNVSAQNAEYISDDIFEEFVSNTIELIPNFIYKPFSKIISQNTDMYTNEKLIIAGKKPEETLKRLMYFLRLNLERNKSIVINYYSKEYIYNFYDDITDFIKRIDELIIPGNNALLKWVEEKEHKKKMYLHLQTKQTKPYFLKTSNKEFLQNKVYLGILSLR